MKANGSNFLFFPISVGESYTLRDIFALSWIFSSVLAFGMMTLDVNMVSLLIALTSVSLAGIWWMLSHYK